MEFGLFYLIPLAAGQDPRQRYQDTIEQIVLADELGFDVVWLGEQHLRADNSLMSAPMLVAAAAAARTRRIRIGIAVTLLPLHNPPPPGRGGGDGGRAKRGALGVRGGAGDLPPVLPRLRCLLRGAHGSVSRRAWRCCSAPGRKGHSPTKVASTATRTSTWCRSRSSAHPRPSVWRRRMMQASTSLHSEAYQ